MDPINEAYQQSVNEMRPPIYQPWQDKKNRIIGDFSDAMFQGGIRPDKLSHYWWEITLMFNINPKEIKQSEIKKFLADFEELGMYSVDNEKNIDGPMIRKFMKKWIA